MSSRSEFSDNIDVPLNYGIFYIFGKLRRILGGSKFCNKPKKIHQKFCFDIANQLLGGFHPNPNELINPPPPPLLPTAPKVDMLPIGNIWQ